MDTQEIDALALSAQKSESCMNQLLVAIRPHIRNIVRNFEVWSSDIDDLGQEIIILVYRNFQTFDPKLGTFMKWFGTIAINRTIDYIRSSNRRRRLLERIMLLQEPFSYRLNNYKDMDLIELTRKLIDRLPPTTREPLRLELFALMSNEEISRKLGQKLGTIKSQLLRGKKKLRPLLLEMM